MRRNIHLHIDVIHQTTNNSLKMNMGVEEQCNFYHGAVKAIAVRGKFVHAKY